VPIDAATLAAHIEEHGAFLYHVTDAAHCDAVLRDGLRPGSELGHYVRDDFFRTRQGHVYLCDRRRGVPVVPIEGDRVTLQVDLRHLDVVCFDTDEDVPRVQETFQATRWFDVGSPRRRMLSDGAEAPGQAGALAAWAEAIAGFDDPEFAARSLAAGRVAYRGTIPVLAVQAAQLPSEIVEIFTDRACRLLEIDGMGTVPTLAYCDVEADRAFAIAQHVLDAGQQLLGHPAPLSDTQLSDPMKAYYLEAAIRRFGYDSNRAGDWGPRDLAFALADLAQAAHDFDRALGWDPDACVAIAERAATCLAQITMMAGRDTAAAIARAAIAKV
jgi:hypothetical protein